MNAPEYVLEALYSEGKEATMENIIDVLSRSISRELFGTRYPLAETIFDEWFGEAVVAITYETKEARNARLLQFIEEMENRKAA